MKKVILLLGIAMSLAVGPVIAMSSPAYAEKKAAKELKEGEVAPEFEYYEVPPVNLPVITERGLTQQVSLAISIEIPYGKKEEIAVFGPKLVDAYIRDLFGVLGNGQIMVKGGAVDVNVLKSRLTAVTERVLGKDKKELCRELLLQAVQQHNI
jgi:hypothetical protein